MKCPICKEINLVISTRDGIEIDYCPECRGIWLDRGELDKIIESSQKYEKNNNQYQKNYSESHHDDKHNYDKNHDSRYKKKSFLGDMFDF
jgi:Zn-finger nucleic acid-binding protein